jgi:ABC-type multidrug transport system ATPase subunit
MDVRFKQVVAGFKRRSERVLDGLDLSIKAGEHVVLLGSSGAGKTTLLRVILGFVRPTAGEVRVGGRNPFGSRGEATAVRQRTGFVRQRDDLVLGVTARTNILMSAVSQWHLRDWLGTATGNVPKRYAHRVRSLASRHGVESLLDSRVEELSGGQRQRVALVRALLPEPDLLLADETTSGLDPGRAAAALAHLREATRARLIVTTHDLSIAQQFRGSWPYVTAGSSLMATRLTSAMCARSREMISSRPLQPPPLSDRSCLPRRSPAKVSIDSTGVPAGMCCCLSLRWRSGRWPAPASEYRL